MSDSRKPVSSSDASSYPDNRVNTTSRASLDGQPAQVFQLAPNLGRDPSRSLRSYWEDKCKKAVKKKAEGLHQVQDGQQKIRDGNEKINQADLEEQEARAELKRLDARDQVVPGNADQR